MKRPSSTMETYLRRAYGQKSAASQKDYPFWDYRSRRGSLTPSLSSTSSYDGSSISSISSGRSESENISISEHSDTDSLMLCDPNRLTLQFLTDAHDIGAMEDLYQPILNWIDPDLHILKITDRSQSRDSVSAMPDIGASLPSLAIMVFLHEEGMVGFERIQSVKRNFEKDPWKFHHSEQVNRGAINPYPYNSQEFYYTSEDLPLWAIRQVHYGREHVRMVLFVSQKNWDTMVQFYKVLVGSEPDLVREDFCLFTVHSHIHFDVQFALKKLQEDTKPRVLESVKLQFRVSNISQISEVFPNVCKPLSDTRWETSDHDGNAIVLQLPGTSLNGSTAASMSDRSSLAERSSLSGGSSFAERNFISHRSKRSGNGQDGRSKFGARNGPIRSSSQRSLTEARSRVGIIETQEFEPLLNEALSKSAQDFKNLDNNQNISKETTEQLKNSNSDVVGLKSFYV